jgi:hypothetical protein
MCLSGKPLLSNVFQLHQFAELKVEPEIVLGLEIDIIHMKLFQPQSVHTLTRHSFPVIHGAQGLD